LNGCSLSVEFKIIHIYSLLSEYESFCFVLYCTSFFFSVFAELENSDSDGGGGDGDDDDDDDDVTAGDRSYVQDTSFLKVRSE
jgi:hypothetical protein